MLEASLLKVQPTAMGRIPPDFLVRAVRLAPKRGRMGRGILPSRISVERPTKDLKREPPPSPAVGPKRSLRCCGSRPSKPPPDPLGNDDTTFKISSLSMEKRRGPIVNDNVIKSMGIGCGGVHYSECIQGVAGVLCQYILTTC